MSHWIDAIDCNGVQTEEYLAEIGYPKNRLTHGHMVADVVGLSKAVAETSDDVVSTLRAMQKHYDIIRRAIDSSKGS